MKRVLSIVLSLLIMTVTFIADPVFADTVTKDAVDTKINTNMYYFSAIKTVVNDTGVAVSISDSGTIATCADLSKGDWKIITNKKDMELQDIIVVDNKFMAAATIGMNSLLLTSGDGVNWTEKTIKGYYIDNMFYINDTYFTIAIDSKKQYAIFQTDDFITFNKIEAENDIGINIYPKVDESNLYVSDMVYFKGRYFLSGMYSVGDPRYFFSDSCKGIVISSKDLKTWEVCTETETILRDMVQSENALIAYGGDSYPARLSDKNQISSMTGRGIQSTNMVYSQDGENFNVCNINFETNAGAFDKITYTGDKFFGITYKKIGISSDGITWTTQSDAVNWLYGGYHKGKYIAVGTDIHDNSRNVIAASTGNSGWSVTECSTNFSTNKRSTLPSFAVASGGYYILSEDSTDISSDLLNWKSNLGNELNRYKDILFDGSRFVAITEHSVISSLDGESWKTNYKLGESEDTSPQFNELHFSKGKYYIYGIKWGQGWESYVWISEDLNNWNEYKLHINNYIENAHTDLANIKVSIIGDLAVLTHSSYEEEKMIIATSEDMYNFTPILTDSYKWNIGNLRYYNNQYFVFATQAGSEEELSSNPFYTVTKGSGFRDYIFLSDDLKTFKKVELPSTHIREMYFFKDSFILAAREYPKFKVYVTKDFINYESYEIPSDTPNLNVAGDEEGIYKFFSIDDVLYLTGARVICTTDFRDWAILDSVPSNAYFSAAVKGNLAVMGGTGSMVRIAQKEGAYNLTGAQNLLNEALTQKTLYSYNMAYNAIAQLYDISLREQLMGKLASLQNVVWTEDVSKAVSELSNAWNTKTAEAILKAESTINQVKNEYNRSYLMEELEKISVN